MPGFPHIKSPAGQFHYWNISKQILPSLALKISRYSNIFIITKTYLQSSFSLSFLRMSDSKTCPSCGYIVPAQVTKCQRCGNYVAFNYQHPELYPTEFSAIDFLDSDFAANTATNSRDLMPLTYMPSPSFLFGTGAEFDIYTSPRTRTSFFHGTAHLLDTQTTARSDAQF